MDTQCYLDALGVVVQINRSVMWWGPPGIAKSSIIRALAAGADRHLEFIAGGQAQPDSISVPVPPREPGQGVTLEARAFVHRIKAAHAIGRASVVFLDEASRMTPATQGAFLSGMTERRFGDETIPDDTAFVLAANPADSASGAFDLDPATANRVCHLAFTPSLEWWTDQAINNWPAPTFRRVPAGWRAGLGQAMVMVTAFLHKRADLANAEPKDDASRGKAWPSYRSWTYAAEALAACEACGASNEVTALLVSGYVGDGAALEFLNYRRELDLPDPEVVLKTPKALKLPNRGDLQYAVLNSVVAAVLAKNTPARWGAAWDVLAVAAERIPDVAAQAARALAKNRPAGAPTPASAAKFSPVLKAAGLLQ